MIKEHERVVLKASLPAEKLEAVTWNGGTCLP